MVSTNVPQLSALTTRKIVKAFSTSVDFKKIIPDITKKQEHDRKFILNVIEAKFPGQLKDLVKAVRKKQLKKRQTSLKQYAEIKGKYAKKLAEFVSKRETEKDTQRRFVGMLQEDRQKEVKPRKYHSKVEFDFVFDVVIKKVKWK